MSIQKQTISQNIVDHWRTRLEKLKSLNAPECMTEHLEHSIAKGPTFRGVKEYGHLEFTKKEVKKGRGGKQYVVFHTEVGLIYYFPNARYGPFMKVFES